MQTVTSAENGGTERADFQVPKLAARSSQSVLHLIQSPPSRLLFNPGTHG